MYLQVLMQRITLWFWRLMATLRLHVPFDPVSGERYVEHAARYTIRKLTDEQAAHFQSDVDTFVRAHRVGKGQLPLTKALSLSSRLDREQFTMDPTYEAEMLYVQHRKMMEVIVKNGACYIALFHATGGNVRKLSLHQRVYNWRDGRLRRVRYLEAADGSMRPVTRFERDYIYNPFEPIVVYAPDLELGHTLRQWLAMENTKE